MTAGNFEKHCRAIASDFLQTVVIVDNQPEPEAKTVEGPATRSRATSPLKAAAKPRKEADDTVAAQAETDSHRLEYRTVANAFAAKGLTCGSFYPDQEKLRRSEIVETSVDIARHADVAILDWQLEDGSPDAAIEIVGKLLSEDRDIGGRLRLIAIYTAATPLEDQTKTLKDALPDLPLVQTSPVTLEDKNCRIRFFNKPTIGSQYGDDTNVVAWNQLPDRVEQEFADFTKGLLRSFALKSVASIRADTHRILAQFPPELDGAFAGQRASLPDPDDAGRLMKDVMLSEISNSIETMDVPSATLGSVAAQKWLADQSKLHSPKANIQFKPKPGGLTYNEKSLNIDAVARRYLLKAGLSEKTDGNGTQLKKIFSAFYADNAESDKAQRKFSMLTTLVTHPGRGGDRLPVRKPILTLGVLLEEVPDGDGTAQRLLCLQPRCDSVRLTKERGFLMVELEKDNSTFDLIVMDDQEPTSFRLNHKDPRLTTIVFKPSKTEKAVVADKSDGAWVFLDSQDRRWRWLGEVRETQVLSYVAKLTGNYSRIGIDQSEWLRLHSS